VGAGCDGILEQDGHPDVGRVDGTLGREAARRAGARAFVLPTIRRFDRVFSLDASVVDPVTGESLFSFQERGTGISSVPSMIDRLARRVRERLQESEQGLRAASAGGVGDGREAGGQR